MSKNQNRGCQYDPGWGHPAHPQRRVHGLSVPQHRCGWLRQHTHTFTFLHTQSKHITTLRTKNQVYSSLCFNLLFLLVLPINILREIVPIYYMLHMKQLRLCFVPVICCIVELYKQYKLFHFTNIWFLPFWNTNNTTQCVMQPLMLQNLANKTIPLGWVKSSLSLFVFVFFGT